MTEGNWQVVILPLAEKALRRLGRTDQERLLRAISRLPGGDVKRLVGGRGELRLRVGDWRVIFERNEEAHIITVHLVAPRGSVYKP